MIKYRHSGYDRCYETEIVAKVNAGVVESEAEYKNGVKPGDMRFSREPYEIQAEIYRRIDWDRIPKLSKDKRLFLTIKVDELGKLIESGLNGEIEKEYKDQIESVVASFPAIQVFYSRGEPANESWIIPIIFSREFRNKYAR